MPKYSRLSADGTPMVVDSDVELSESDLGRIWMNWENPEGLFGPEEIVGPPSPGGRVQATGPSREDVEGIVGQRGVQRKDTLMGAEYFNDPYIPGREFGGPERRGIMAVGPVDAPTAEFREAATGRAEPSLPTELTEQYAAAPMNISSLLGGAALEATTFGDESRATEMQEESRGKLVRRMFSDPDTSLLLTGIEEDWEELTEFLGVDTGGATIEETEIEGTLGFEIPDDATTDDIRNIISHRLSSRADREAKTYIDMGRSMVGSVKAHFDLTDRQASIILSMTDPLDTALDAAWFVPALDPVNIALKAISKGGQGAVMGVRLIKKIKHMRRIRDDALRRAAEALDPAHAAATRGVDTAKQELRQAMTDRSAEIAEELQASAEAPTATRTTSQEVIDADLAARQADMEAGLAGDQADLVAGGVGRARAMAEVDISVLDDTIAADTARAASDYLPEGVEAPDVPREVPQSVRDAEEAALLAERELDLADTAAADAAAEQGGRMRAAGTRAEHLVRDIETAQGRPVGAHPLAEGPPPESTRRASTETQQAQVEALERERLAALADERAQTTGEGSAAEGIQGSEYTQLVNQEKAAVRRRIAPDGVTPEPKGSLSRLANPERSLDVDLDITARDAAGAESPRQAVPELSEGQKIRVDYTIAHTSQAALLEYVQGLLAMSGSKRKLGSMTLGARQSWEKTAQMLIDEGYAIYDKATGKLIPDKEAADAIADGILDHGRSASPVEQLALARSIDDVSRRMEIIAKDMSGPMDAPTGDLMYVDAEKAAVLDGLSERFKRLHDAEGELGTRLGQALNERKRFISADVKVAQFLSRERVSKGRALTLEEVAKITSRVEAVDTRLAQAGELVESAQEALARAMSQKEKLASGALRGKKGSPKRVAAEAELADARKVAKDLKTALRDRKRDLRLAEDTARKAAKDLESMRKREAKVRDAEDKAIELQELDVEIAAVRRGVEQSKGVAKEAATASKKAERELARAEKSLAKELARDEARGVRVDKKAEHAARAAVKKKAIQDLRGYRDRAKALAAAAKEALHEAEMAARKAAREAKSKRKALEAELEKADRAIERAETRDLRGAQRAASRATRDEHLAELRGTRAALKKGIRDGEARLRDAEAHWREKNSAHKRAEDTLSGEIDKADRAADRLDAKLKRQFDKDVEDVAHALAAKDKKVQALKKKLLSAKAAERIVAGVKERIYGEIGDGPVISVLSSIGRGVQLSTPLTTLGDLSFIGRQFAGGLLWATVLETKGVLGGRYVGIPGSAAAKTIHESLKALVSPVAARDMAASLRGTPAAKLADDAGIIWKNVEDITVAGDQANEEVMRALEGLGVFKPGGVAAGIIRRSNNSIALAGNMTRRILFDHYAAVPGFSPGELGEVAHLINTITGATSIRGPKTPRVHGGVLGMGPNKTAWAESLQRGYIRVASELLIAPRLYLSQAKLPFTLSRAILGKSARVRGAAMEAVMGDMVARFAAYGSLNYLAAKLYDGLTHDESMARMFASMIPGSPYYGKLVYGGEQVGLDSGTSPLWRYILPAPTLKEMELFSPEGLTEFMSDPLNWDYANTKWMGERYIEKAARGLKYKTHPMLGSLFDIANSETFYGATKEMEDYGEEWEYWFDRVAAPILGSYIAFPFQTAAKNIAGALVDDTGDTIFLGKGDQHLVDSPPWLAPIKTAADFFGFTSGKSRYAIEEERAARRRGGGAGLGGGGLGGGGLGGGDLGGGIP